MFKKEPQKKFDVSKFVENVLSDTTLAQKYAVISPKMYVSSNKSKSTKPIKAKNKPPKSALNRKITKCEILMKHLSQL